MKQDAQITSSPAQATQNQRPDNHSAQKVQQQSTPSQHAKQVSQQSAHIKKDEPGKQRLEADNEKLNEKLLSYFREQFTERKTDITNR